MDNKTEYINLMQTLSNYKFKLIKILKSKSIRCEDQIAEIENQLNCIDELLLGCHIIIDDN